MDGGRESADQHRRSVFSVGMARSYAQHEFQRGRLVCLETGDLAAALWKQGYTRQKWFFAHGPGEGPDGLMKNVALVKQVRTALGDNAEIMFDAYSGWNLDYAIAWAKLAEPYRPRWIEEAFHPEKMDSFVELRKKTSIPVATGEHLYGRWEAYEYLKAGAIHGCVLCQENKIATLLN